MPAQTARESKTRRSRGFRDARQGPSQRPQPLAGGASAMRRRRSLQQADPVPGMYVEAFVPYTTNVVPIPATTQPSRYPAQDRCKGSDAPALGLG